MPVALLTALFSATIVGSTAAMVRIPDVSWDQILFYAFLVFYRSKIFIDDLVYYHVHKTEAFSAADLIIALIAWVGWLAAAITLDTTVVFLWFMVATFGASIVWIVIATVNVWKANDAGDTRKAHVQWGVANVLIIIGLLLCLAHYVLRYEIKALGYEINVLIIGFVVLWGTLLIDSILNWEFTKRITLVGKA